METEFHNWHPKNVSVHTARILLPEVSNLKEKIEAFKLMNDELKDASVRIASVEPSVIVYGCTSGSFLGDKDAENREIIENNTSTKAMTVTEAVLAGIKILKLKKICMASPYPPEIERMEKIFIENKLTGVKIMKTEGLGIIGNLPKGRLSPETAYQTAKKVNYQYCDGILISCTNWRTFEIIQKLEDEIGKPVITSNQAALWYALKICNILEPIEGLGKLFQVK
jgi:maleate isomerase